MMALLPRRDDAAALAGLIQSCLAARINRQVLLLRLGSLPPELTRPHHLRLLFAALDPLLGADRAQLFRIAERTAVVVWRGQAPERLEAAIAGLQLLLADMPVALPDFSTLVELLELPANAETLAQEIRESSQDAALSPGDGPAQQRLDTRALAALEQSLAQTDLASFARRKPVGAVARSGAVRIAWEKRFLALDELAATTVPGVNLRAERSLFRRLVRTLDRRLLVLLAEPADLRQSGPLAMNMHVGGILSAEFQRFDAALPPALRGQVVLDLAAPDILADPRGFLFARDFARARGYRLGLHGLAQPLLAALPVSDLGLDYVHLRWSPEFARLPDAGRAALDAIGDLERVVLASVHHEAALEWGLAQGIGLFQGSLIRQALQRGLVILPELSPPTPSAP